jgi:prepilin-type N-terminal cleavage/methylation domain-containing protein
MRSVDNVNIRRRETVETVPCSAAAGNTSLKRGVNEKDSRTSNIPHSTLSARLAFTLIELLVVIGIMAILAALIIPITGAVTRHKLRSRTRSELRSIETAIEDYKSKKGYYPPDNPNSPLYLNQLYYELSGTSFSNDVYTTLDGSATVTVAQLAPGFGGGFGPRSQINGIMNTTKGGGDEGMAAQKYLRDLKPAQVATTVKGIKILVGSVGWEPNWPWQPLPAGPPYGPTKPGMNPFCYVSTNPTNNPKSFDLWIDILVQGKTNRVCNWSEDVIVL